MPEHDEEAEFEKWVVNMDKYAKMMGALKKQQQKKELERQLKEAEEEQKYYKKFMKMQEEKEKKNQTIKPKPSAPIDILNKAEDYGEYSNYF
jgi:Sec-independent protein translocase protein TatA